MWNERFASETFAYGTEPNDFLRDHAGLLTSPVVSLAEGEGRNAVFLAGLGLDVLGIDLSDVGLAKAQRLASSRGLTIRTVVDDLASYTPRAETFGSAVAIFAHIPSIVRRSLNQRVVTGLKPGGAILLEAYSIGQVGRKTGGPQDPDLCYRVEDLAGDFPGCDLELAREIERDVVEGAYHTGRACVVQMIARKRA